MRPVDIVEAGDETIAHATLVSDLVRDIVMITVVHCKRQPFTHYIGRPGPFGNPYRVQPGMPRGSAIAKFETYARGSTELLAKIDALPPDAVLGCWCSPNPYHGDIIVKLWKELHD